jgi:ADP-heptose:LPS heptosyltransferase
MKLRGNAVLRALDRWLGIPAVLLLSLLPRRQRPLTIRRVGLLRSAAVGDTLLMSGVLRDIRAALPDADLVFVTGEANAAAGLMSAGSAARVLTIPVGSPLAAIRRLRREKFDVFVDCGQWPRIDALLCALSGARFRVGFESRGQLRHFAFDASVPHASDVHELENFRRVARAAGFESATQPLVDRALLPLPPPVAASPYIVFHPWSGGFQGHRKEWPLDRWCQLGVRLQDLCASIQVVGSAHEASRAQDLVARMRAAGCNAVPAAGLSLPDLAAFVAASRATVAVNTGVMHLAAILGVPTVALDGPTPPHRWGPIGPRAVSVTPTGDGCGFFDMGLEWDGQPTDCMERISVESAQAAVRRLLRDA